MSLDLVIYLLICFTVAGGLKALARFAVEYDAPVISNPSSNQSFPRAH